MSNTSYNACLRSSSEVMTLIVAYGSAAAWFTVLWNVVGMRSAAATDSMAGESQRVTTFLLAPPARILGRPLTVSPSSRL